MPLFSLTPADPIRVKHGGFRTRKKQEPTSDLVDNSLLPIFFKNFNALRYQRRPLVFAPFVWISTAFRRRGLRDRQGT